MIEQSVSLASNGVVKVPGYEQLVRFGYTKNRGVYRLAVTASGEWEGMTIRAFWHVPDGKDPASSLVVDGYVDVPASVTAQPGSGCITFEGSDGTKTVTSADLRYRVAANSGTEDGTEPEPGTPAWQAFVDAVKESAASSEQSKTEALDAAQQAGASAQKAGQALSDTITAKEDALKAIGDKQTAATQAVDTALDKALRQVEASTESAQTAASEAATSAGNANQSAQEAADSLRELKDGIASGDFKGEKGDKGDTGPIGPQGEQGPQGPAVALDPTLSISGKAADAKATGDAIGQLKEDLSHVITKTQLEESNTYDRIAFIGNENQKKICISSDVEISVQVCGKNILDISDVSFRKIKNDSGTEIDDWNGRYNLNMIPVNPGETIYVGFGAQRVYQYDENGDWLRRTGAHDQTSIYGTFIIPDDCFFVQFQWNATDSINKETPQVERGSVGTEYEVYKSVSVTVTTEKTEIVIPAYATIFSSIASFTVTEKGEIIYSPNDEFKKAILDHSIIVPACLDYPIWEPSEATDEYSSAIGANQVTISITLSEFLSEYFDKYIGVNADGYKVTKRSIGRDSSNDYEIMEYTFRPERYNRTILISAGMNPCETSPMFGAAYLVKSIMDGTDEPGLNYLRENVRFIIIPCIAPWGFDQSPLKYYNYNGVRINKNFDYNGSWKQMPSNENPGESADSEAETKILKAWLSQWANRAELWIDCHSDTFGNTPRLHQVITSSSDIGAIIQPVQQRITNYYFEKGYIEDSTVSDVQPSWWTSPLTNYPKTLYSEKIAGIPALMIEQYVNGTFYGSDGTHNNDSYGIKNYVLMLRAFILACLKRNAISINTDAVPWMAYQYSLN